MCKRYVKSNSLDERIGPLGGDYYLNKIEILSKE